MIRFFFNLERKRNISGCSGVHPFLFPKNKGAVLPPTEELRVSELWYPAAVEPGRRAALGDTSLCSTPDHQETINSPTRAIITTEPKRNGCPTHTSSKLLN